MRALLTIVFVASIAQGALAGPFYWTDISPNGTGPGDGLNSAIKRANADGSGVETLMTGLKHPRGMTLDVPGGMMYWSEPGLHAIRRANLDGTGPTDTLIADAWDGTAGIALDTSQSKMYWTDSNTSPVGRIRRSNLDGTGVEVVVGDAGRNPTGISLDLENGKMYWTDLEGNLDGTGKIQRSNLDGSSVETLITGIDEANGLALDAVGGKIYWPDLATGKIQRANLDGSGLEDLVTGLDTPTTIGLDLLEGTMYWTDSGFGGQANRIERANLDGSGREIIVSGGFPWGIAVVPEPSTALLLTTASLFVLRRRRLK